MPISYVDHRGNIEASALSHLRHRRVVNMFGVCYDFYEDTAICIEYQDHGGLGNFLRSKFITYYFCNFEITMVNYSPIAMSHFPVSFSLCPKYYFLYLNAKEATIILNFYYEITFFIEK